jgi:GT2 family glycosyltransferase/glycosyltransferase involved in cell wall biosynthesis
VVVRILLVHHVDPFRGLGGSERCVEWLARALREEHEVALLHPAEDSTRPSLDVRQGRRDGMDVFTITSAGRGFETYHDPAVTAAAARIVDEWRPDVVHVHHLAGLSTGLVTHARARGAAVVITFHDFWPVCPLGQLVDLDLHVCPGPEPARRCLGCVGGQVAIPDAVSSRAPRLPLLGAAAGALARMAGAGGGRVAARRDEMCAMANAADVRVAPSRFVATRLEALGLAPIEVVPNGHEPLEVAAPEPDGMGRVRFGFLGAAIPSKGVHILAEAFRRLDPGRAALRIHGPFPPYHGDVTYEARVRALLGPYAEEAIRGPFAPDRLSEVLAGIDVLVAPSIWEENAPLVIEEALLSRRPVLVSDHGGLAERVRHGIDGLRVAPNDATALAAAMEAMLDPSYRHGLGLRPPHVPSPAEHARAVLEVYERARARRRHCVGRVGVVVLDHRRPEEAARAAVSAFQADVAPRVLVVRNGPGPEAPLPAGIERMDLPSNLGYAGGMNQGVARLAREGCDRVLLLNNDATLDPGGLRRLAEALDDPGVAAAGPLVLRPDGRVESRGIRFDPRSGRLRLIGHGQRPSAMTGVVAATSLSGAAWMVRTRVFEALGGLDEDYFFGFEETDWCARARGAGWRLAVVLDATARHEGGRSLPRASPQRLYYAARNHLRAAQRIGPLPAPARWLRGAAIVTLNLLHALRQTDLPRGDAARWVVRGVRDYGRGRFGAWTEAR